MKEHPILFSGPMVRALLAGTKTQTRRTRNPRWVAGDRLWVREAWALHRQYDDFAGANIFGLPEMGCLRYKADVPYPDYIGRPRHARFMPRWASRITLEVIRTWEEQLQDISEDDAIAEGCTQDEVTAEDIADLQISDSSPDVKELARLLGPGIYTAKGEYMMLWDSINGKTAPWASNPTVYATEFRVVANG